MKLNSPINYRDDNTVDFSRKRRVTRNNSGVSGRYLEFCPEDLTVDTEDYEVNPSVNKSTYEISDCFEDNLNDHAGLLNKGKRRRPMRVRDLTRGLEDIIDRF